MKLSHSFGWMRPRGPGRPGCRHGFTLIELLTATAVMTAIVSLVMTILIQITSSWDRSSDDLRMSSRASELFQWLSQDLQTAIFRADGNQWLSLTTETPQGSPISSANMSRLIFYTSAQPRQSMDAGTPGAAGNPIPGDICAVEYRVTYADPFGNASSTDKTFQLHRVVVDPASTFLGVGAHEPLMGIGENGKTSYNSLTQAFDGQVDLAAGAVPSQLPMGGATQALNVNIYGADTTASMAEDDVAQFDVFLYFYGYSGTNGGVPAIQAYPETTYNVVTPPAYYYGGSPLTGGAPTPNSPGYLDTWTNAGSAPAPNQPTFVALAYADVTVTFLTDDGVALLQSFGGSLPQGFSWPQFVQQYGKTYTQRIRFYNKPH